MTTKKILLLSDLVDATTEFDLKDYSLCFGHFNIIHPGHLRYLQTARLHNEKIVVALESDKQLAKSSVGDWFPEGERAEAVAALEIVDKVIILDSGYLVDLVKILEPRVLVLGREFERDRANEVAEAIASVRIVGGKIIYATGEVRFASTNLFAARQDELELEKWRSFEKSLTAKGIELDDLSSRLTKGDSSNLLIIGDTIVDQYIACDPVGMSAEAPVVVVKELDRRDFIGGAAIVSAHAAALGANSKYLSVTGEDPEADMVYEKLVEAGVTPHLIKDSTRPTTKKIRYMVENQKLFRVSRLKEHSISKELEQKLIGKIWELAASADAIIVSDFVYGVITPTIVDELVGVAKHNNISLLGDLQCSSQIGNVTKFNDFFLICPTEREARIALANRDDSIEYIANLLMEKTRCQNLIIKLGAEGLIVYSKDNSSEFIHRQHFPSLSTTPVDVTGAGDSMLAAVAVGITKGLSLVEAAALGCCVSAVAVQRVGNIQVVPDELSDLIQKRKSKAYGW